MRAVHTQFLHGCPYPPMVQLAFSLKNCSLWRSIYACRLSSLWTVHPLNVNVLWILSGNLSFPMVILPFEDGMCAPSVVESGSPLWREFVVVGP